MAPCSLFLRRLVPAIDVRTGKWLYYLHVIDYSTKSIPAPFAQSGGYCCRRCRSGIGHERIRQYISRPAEISTCSHDEGKRRLRCAHRRSAQGVRTRAFHAQSVQHRADKDYPTSYTVTTCVQSRNEALMKEGGLCQNCFAECPASGKSDEELTVWLTAHAG